MNKKTLIIFAGAFVVGALLALALRSARHDPYSAPAQDSAPAVAPMPAAPADPHAGHDHGKATVPTAQTPVNTVCAICGMDVDPKLPTALYQGKVIGFGCKACPGQFAANPEKYGPAALANRVVE